MNCPKLCRQYQKHPADVVSILYQQGTVFYVCFFTNLCIFILINISFHYKILIYINMRNVYERENSKITEYN